MLERNTRIRRKKRKQLILMMMAAGVAVAFLCSASLLLSAKLAEKREQTAFGELIGQVEASSGGEFIVMSPPTRGDVPKRESGAASKYQPLFEKNADFAGWVCIDGTNVNYPVMLSPDDPEYYLHRAFDGSKSKSGVPFLGENCTVDSNNILIYGHNMKNGTMFADLLKYTDPDFRKAHPIIRFDTLAEEGSYEVVAVFYSQISNELDAFCYYNYGGELGQDTFTQYVDGFRKAALYNTGATPSYGDTLITLSTYSHHTDDGRFVVVARKAR